MRHLTRILSLIILTVLISSSLIFQTSPVAAQTGQAGQADQTRYDNYPHPASRGALRYSLADRWDQTNLSYQFNNCPSRLNCDQAHNVIRQAFADWDSVSALSFREVSGGADIEITWDSGRDMDGDTLGYAYFPGGGGDIFLNDQIPWELNRGSEYDLYLTTAHEIGHAVGLDHSSDASSLMYPTATDQTTGIASDDINGIQALYGGPSGSPPTLDVDNTPTSVDLGNQPGVSSADVDGVLSDNTPYELWELEVEAGETLSIIMNAVDGNLRPQVAILTEDEEDVIAESNNSDSTEASLTVTFPYSGIYIILASRVEGRSGSTQGGYLLYVEDTTPQAGTDGGFGNEDFDDNNDYDDFDYGYGFDGTVEVANFTGVDICELYVSPSSSDSWEEDWLEGLPLADGESIISDFESGLYDVLAIKCNGDEIEGYELNVPDGATIELYRNSASVYP